ncbi:MAG: hypothetical protein E7579_00135 [Ruminococcaceae bacterium]|nr:hypothetical protein [Oscillospiraceae bacterium]
MDFYFSMVMIFLLGFGIRLVYFRLKKGWIVTLVVAVVTGIAWLWNTDGYDYHNEGEPIYLLISTALFAGTVLGEITVQLLRYRKMKKSLENTSKGEPT